MKKLAVLLALLLVLAVFPVSALAADSGYEQTLFDRSSLIEIDIQMDDETWDNMIATADEEEYSSCNLMVNGVLYENVAIRPKGNSSMSSVTRKNSERYSWRIKFDKYDKDQTCDGLDILILNNGFNDPGNLQEIISYDMFAYLGADASLVNFAVVYHNGEYFGVYLALEGVDEVFVERRYGEDHGELYKPELSGMGANKNNNNNNDNNAGADRASGEANGRQDREAAASAEPAQADGSETASAEPVRAERTEERSERSASAEQGEESEERGERSASAEKSGREEGASREARSNTRGASSSSLAMALNYVGDDLESYQGIWDSAKFKSDEEDYARVVEAIKHVCEGDNIDDYLFVDNVLKYLAIQTFIYNRDGLTGTVAHNYYLYEQDGKLNLIPWDLNESFTVSASSYVNFPIDTPFAVSDLSQRSFFMALLENEEYLAQYHEYLRQLSEEYVQGGALASLLENVFSQVGEYYQTDPTIFADYSTIEAKAEGLQALIELRAESVLGQLSGDIPSTRDGQEAEPEKLLDTSGADLSGLSGSSEMGRR